MRSSVACLKCRTSKIKCLNDGLGFPCERCVKQGDECVYATAASPGTPRLNHDRPSLEGELSKKRQKKSMLPTGNGAHSSKDPLDSPALTAKVWLELFEIFQRHFATDLPFIHVPTFRGPFEAVLNQQVTAPLPTNPSLAQQKPRPSLPYFRPFMLMFLALTSRFHPDLVAATSPDPARPVGNPLKTAGYYATEARKYLKISDSPPTDFDEKLQYIQAYLMLVIHEWGERRGEQAFLIMSYATSMVEIVLLTAGKQPPGRKGTSTKQESQRKKRTPTEEETLRRTFWSCFIMQCYLGGRTPQVERLNVRGTHMFFPCSDRAFTLGEKVRTLPFETLHDDSTTSVQLDHGTQSYLLEAGHTGESLSCFIRAQHIYGDVLRWSCAGGRRQEKKGPWHEDSLFKQYRNRLERFENNLPSDLQLTPEKIHAHDYLKSLSSYTLMHIARLLCHIMLHREYLPFLPFGVEKPGGPLDEPRFSPEELKEIPETVPTFWEESARTCFKAARELLNLLVACQSKGVLVESPLSGMAAFQVAIVACWCDYFPAQDQDGYMSKHKSEPSDNEAHLASSWESQKITLRAMQILSQMRKRLRMAKKWMSIVRKLHKYLNDKKLERRRICHPNSPESTTSGSSSSTRQGDAGLSDYKKFEHMLKDMSTLMNEDDDEDDDENEDCATDEKSLLESVQAESHDDGSTVSKENTPDVNSIPPSFTAVNGLVQHEPNRSMAINHVIQPTPIMHKRSHPAPIQASYIQHYDPIPETYYPHAQGQSYMSNPSESARQDTNSFQHPQQQFEYGNTDPATQSHNNMTQHNSSTMAANAQQFDYAAHQYSWSTGDENFRFLQGNPPVAYTVDQGQETWLPNVEATTFG